MFQFLTHVELSRSMAAILEMPQYVAYQKMLFMLLLNSVQSFTVLTFCAQWVGLAALLQTRFKIQYSCAFEEQFDSVNIGAPKFRL